MTKLKVFLVTICLLLLSSPVSASSIYPALKALTGGGNGALDKITTTADKDAALAIFNDHATYGNAFMPFSLDADGGAAESAPTVIDSGDGGTEDWELCKGYFTGVILYGDSDLGDFDLDSIDRLEFFDAGLYIDGGTDGTLLISSDGTLQIDTADWDISTTGAITGVSLDCNGAGNTITNINAADHANEDWGDFTVAAGSFTLDDDVVSTAEMADADHGHISWTGGSATVEDFTLNAAADAGDQTIANAGDITFNDTAAIKTETDTNDDYSAWEATDDIGGTPAQIEAIRVTNSATSAATTVIVGNVNAAAIIELDATADQMANEGYNGIVITGRNAGEAIDQGNLVYWDNTDSEWKEADADAVGRWPARGVALSTGSDGNPLDVLVQGIMRHDDWTNYSVGATLYLADVVTDNAGPTATAPSTSGDCVQVVGWAVSADEVYFNFSGHYLEVE